jgi:2-C-methyl-D-erythritol 2,4-cyclodiphosphate synthase
VTSEGSPTGGEPRVGLGIDLHARGTGLDRPLFLGGVRFDGEPGLVGHSDGDVVCHAVADALLGAAGLGDLGQHFPDTDQAFAGIAGLDLLSRVAALIRDRGFAPRQCDLTLILERPAVAPHREEIRRNLASILGVDLGEVSVKATRPEGLGLTGDGAGCLALVSVVRLGPG